MKTQEEKMEAYNEAKSICEKYHNFTGDKRSSLYKNIERNVMECYAKRMTNFGKMLNLPTYTECYFN